MVEFEFAKRTREILENISLLNPSILFREGNEIRSIAPTRDMFITASIVESIPKEFAVYDLSRFLGALSLFDKAVITFGDKSLTIKEGEQTLKYTYAAESMVTAAPKNDIPLPETVLDFILTDKDLTALNKAAGYLRAPNIAVVANGSDLVVTAVDPKNITSDTYSVKIGSTDKKFNVNFNAEKIQKLIQGDYKVKITYGSVKGTNVGITLFETQDVKYIITAEDKLSTYN